MKTALCKYTHAGADLTVAIYFDNKAFEFLTPPLSSEEEDALIRLIGDSMAAAMPKDSAEKHFYVKRVLRYPQSIKLLCTDGFMIDSALILPVSQQAFATERIRIAEVEQLPARLKLTNETIKNINDRLPLFEEAARRDFSQVKAAAARETVKQEKIAVSVRETAADEVIDVLAEIGNVKKEIREIADNSTRQLKALSAQIDGVSARILDEVMKATESNLQFEDNKKKLDEFANSILSRSGGGNVEKTREELRKKIEEITPIPEQFENETSETAQLIAKQINTLTRFKQHLINALYTSAAQFHEILTKQMQSSPPHARKIMLNEFNKKFSGIARLSESGELSSLNEAMESLGNLPLERFQDIISSEDKENPGLLQKCNTSWTEESPELQIVMKNIGQLNPILSGIFKDDPEFSRYAREDMIQIIRIPFPRSFQFKFSSSALGYKKSVDDFCRTQKDKIINLSKAYKRTMQIDDVRDKTQRAMTEIQRQTALMKKPVADYRDLLKRKESSGMIIASANKDHALTMQYTKTANQLLEVMNTKVDPTLKNMLKKISNLAQEIQARSDASENIIQSMNSAKARIDFTINKFTSQPGEIPSLADLDAKIAALEEQRKSLMEENRVLESLNARLSVYDNAINIADKIAAAVAQSNMRKQQSEAKSLLLQLIKNQTRDPASTEQLKKHMIELYTRVDTSVSGIDKAINELMEAKKQLFSDLNNKSDPPASEFEKNLQNISDKLQALEEAKNLVQTNLSSLRKLSLESTMEKK
ncbi:hypothetical protein AQUSIP_03880 [Aquicella siphonis]|uniref:Uncharacterized protein n=1 Tax=Aquicella siphonis TaxID=254247 RepID=A0A5E4PF23_9COXI|nr:hypothetical protein [Aquicella siphonis]VVC75112.1 hypothetical protein AQUSIP_03880 [Aquicella siphonis]